VRSNTALQADSLACAILESGFVLAAKPTYSSFVSRAAAER
jgi:hypothetical protein